MSRVRSLICQVVICGFVETLLSGGCTKQKPVVTKPVLKQDPYLRLIDEAIQDHRDLNTLMVQDTGGKDEKFLIAVVKGGYKHSLVKLIANGLEITSSEDGARALELCIDQGQIECAVILINKGVLQNYPNKDRLIGRALSAPRYKSEFMAMLIGAGINNVNRINKDGMSFIDFACYKNQYDVVEILIRYGVDVDLHDERSRETPLHVCAQYGRPEIAELLLQNGANINAQNRSEQTPLSIALAPGDPDHEDISGKRKVSEIFKKYGATK